MGGGKSSSSSSTSTTNADNRVVADGSGIAAGAQSTLNYTYTQNLDENAVKLLTNVLETVGDIATGAAGAVDKALGTTQTVAERQQVSPTGNALTDLFSSPAGVLAGIAAIVLFWRKK